jgi:hypothetical protein
MWEVTASRYRIQFPYTPECFRLRLETACGMRTQKMKILGAVLWEGKPWKILIITSGYQLVSIEAISLIVNTWG